MNRNKKVFLTFAVIFILILIYIGYDISSRTTFPGADRRKKINDSAEYDHVPEINGDSIMFLENI